MIQIEFNKPESEEWKKWRELCKLEQEKHNNAIESGENSKVNKRLYKNQKSVYMDPCGPFHGKCAYCEQKIISNQYGDIEHFRPKAGVIDEQTEKPVKIEVEGENIDHPGYYWLAYDCKNLLPSCILCNIDGKGNFFPVKDFRATRPGEEEKEDPLLIHPCLDNPEEHLELDESGIFYARSDKGEMCINIFNLNGRDLPKERKRIYREVRDKMSIACLHLAKGDDELADAKLKDIEEIKNGSEAFTAVARKAIKDSQSSCERITGI